VELLKLTLFAQIPILLLTPVAGVFIDRWNKPLSILLVSLIRAVILLAIPAAFLRLNSIYVFYAGACVLSVFDLVFAPARSALLPEVVSPEGLLPANAAFWALGIVGTLIGFLGGGWLFDYYSWNTSFHTVAILYVAAAALMLPVAIAHRPPPHPVRFPGGPVREEFRFFTRSIRDAVALLRQSRDIRASLIAQAGLFAVGGALSVIGIARIQELSAPGKTLFLSQVGASFIVGLIAGSLGAGMFRERAAGGKAVSVGTLLAGVAIAGMGRTETLIPLCIWGGLLGASMSPIFIVTETILQHRSPRQFTGRVFAAREALIKAGYIAAAILATVVNSFVAKTGVLVGLGLFLALFGVILERTQWLTTETP
jgi:MFS family permease